MEHCKGLRVHLVLALVSPGTDDRVMTALEDNPQTQI